MSKVSPPKKSLAAQLLGQARWKGRSLRERRAHSQMMHEKKRLARQKKSA
jgi:hypothetical protein